ncbi:MAG: diaminopimelate epimerase [Terrimicrobiaceae bacterium]|nr:diaminopimelate epimerase [Terrimicrobiaceae bacterium]
MELPFTKMNGAGNDFVVLDNRNLSLSLSSDQIAHLCDRHRGVGADGLLAVEPAREGADFRMRYYNADGGEAEMCGNGARCFARFAARLLPARPGVLSFETPAGVILGRFDGDLVTINMSTPHDHRPATPLDVRGRPLDVHFINTGVPHAVVFVDDVETVDIRADGAALRWHEAFQPKGTNANFAQVESNGSLVLRTYERGVEDETLACGTGICAAALLHHLAHGTPSPVAVRVRGGDTLLAGFSRSSDGSFSEVTLTGPADFVFDGTISI